MAVSLQHSLLPRGIPDQNALQVAYRYLPGAGGRGRRLVRRDPAVRRARGAGGGRRGGTRPARRRDHGAAAHRRAQLLVARPAPRRTARPPRRGGQPDRPGVHRRPRATTRSPAPPACTPRTTRPRGSARWPGPGTRRPRSCAPTAPSSTPSCPPDRRSGWPTCRSRRRNCTCAEGSQLVLYTDGLIEDRTATSTSASRACGTVLAERIRTPEETCRPSWKRCCPATSATTSPCWSPAPGCCQPERIADWELPSDPAAVAGLRAAVARAAAPTGAWTRSWRSPPSSSSAS